MTLIRSVLRRLGRGLAWLVEPLPERLRAVVVTGLIGVSAYVIGFVVYSNCSVLPVSDVDDIVSARDAEGLSVDLLESEDRLIVWTSDERMRSFDACFQDDLEQPTLAIYSTTSEVAADLLNSVFRKDRVYFEKEDEITFASPESGHPIFVFDDVRLVSHDPEIVSVLLSALSCGSAGAKYLAFFDLSDDKLGIPGPGPLKAFRFYEGEPEPTNVLAPSDPTLAELFPEVQFARYSNEDAIFYADVDDDGQDELVMAFMLWEEGECHWCAHRWVVSFTDVAPLGFRRGFECRGAAVITPSSYPPALVNGFVPGSVSLLGQVDPLNLPSKFRSTDFGRSVIEEAYADPNACLEFEEYFRERSDLVNFTQVPPGEFDETDWDGFPPRSPFPRSD